MPAALAWARDTQQPYKVEILEALRDHGTSRAESREPRAEIDELASEATPGAESASFYRTGAFTDLCRGPHVPDTSWLTAFRLTHLAGRLLARRRAAPDAAADLRDGVSRRSRRSRIISPDWKRRGGGTTAGWGRNWSCSASPTRWAAA